MPGPFRSLLFVPGNNPRFLEKAKSVPADVVCFDLEDSVPDMQKAAARELVWAHLVERAAYTPFVYVRINSPTSGMVQDDLERVVSSGIDGIVIPKVDNVEQLERIVKILARLEAERGLARTSIMPSIESASGVVNCHKIASLPDRVAAVVFGVFDLLNDMGVEYVKGSPGSEYARAKIPVDSRAVGVPAIDAIWQDLRDMHGLKEDCEAGRSLGYAGKSIIHPDQIAVAHSVFRPTPEEIRWAERVRDAYTSAIGKGRGATSVDGLMVDEAHYKRAVSVLYSAGR